jgi:hypothetical protein
LCSGRAGFRLAARGHELLKDILLLQN